MDRLPLLGDCSGVGATLGDGFLPGLPLVVNLDLKAIDRRVRVRSARAEGVDIGLQPVFRGCIVRLIDFPEDIVLNQFIAGALFCCIAG